MGTALIKADKRADGQRDITKRIRALCDHKKKVQKLPTSLTEVGS